MDRGFNFLFQGNRSNFGGQNVSEFRERAEQSDRRYDDFYGNNNNMNNSNMNRFSNNNGGGQMQNHGSGMGGGNWNNSPNNQMGFSNQGGPTPGSMNGPMLSALQQQNILNALMSTQGGKGLLAQQNQNMGQQNRQQRFNQGGHNRIRRGGGGGGGGTRPGDKRKNDNAVQTGFNKQGRRQQGNNVMKKKVTVPPKDTPKDDKDMEEPKEEEIDIPDDEVVILDSLMESVEKLRQRSEIKRNVADEDVEKLGVFCFTGKGYQCKTCGLLSMKESVFSDHLMAKSHVMKVIDARTAKNYQETREILDIDLTTDEWFEKNEVARAIIMKQSKLHMKAERELKEREAENYNKTPSNFFNFNMELRKSVVKKDEEVVITSVVESTVAVKDFTGEKFFGCEFVRAVTGFHCRLCSINIREAKGVIPHIDSKQHKTNYATYIRKNPEYEKTQKEQNQDLYDIMSQHDGKSVVLAESANVEGSQFLSLLDSELVRIPSVMKPELKKDKEKEKEAAKTAEEGKDETAKKEEEESTNKGNEETVDEGKKDEVSASATENAEGSQEEVGSTEQEEDGEEVTEDGGGNEKSDTEEPVEIDQDDADEPPVDEDADPCSETETDEAVVTKDSKLFSNTANGNVDDEETVADEG